MSTELISAAGNIESVHNRARSDQRLAVLRSDFPAGERRSGASHAGAWLGGSRAGDQRTPIRRWILWFAAITLPLAAWQVHTAPTYKAGSGVGYAIGIIGGVMMLLMLLYPLRKHVRWAHNWGPLRYWFMLHMVFGICGPTLVLFHTTFHVKSTNAAISLFSMLLVAASGVVGRFIYRRIHNGLYGRHSNLEELQKQVDSNQEQISALLIEAPAIGEKLRVFRITATAHEGSLPARIWKFLTLGWRRRKLMDDCRRELNRAVDILAQAQRWNSTQRDRHGQRVAATVRDYLAAVQQAAQFSAYERLFRWWHVLHTPFVWLLGISAVVHVIAVNMY